MEELNNINQKEINITNEESSVQSITSLMFKQESLCILIGSLIIAIIYIICITGRETYASLSSVVLFNGMSAIVYIMLKYMKKIVNKRAFLITIPIAVLSLFNVYYEYSYYNTINCLAFYILLATMTLMATDTKINIGELFYITFKNRFSGFNNILKSCGKLSIDYILKIILGLCFAIPVVVIILWLLVVGDTAFSNSFDNIIDKIDLGNSVWHLISFFAVTIFFMGYFYCIIFKKAESKVWKTDTLIAVSFLTPVNLLFLFFCFSQLSYIGDGVPLDYTYSEFLRYSEVVRGGFFQLLWVTFINFVIILAFTEIIKDFSHKLVKLSLIALCMFTFLLILSSYYRMYLYIRTYGFTPLRIEVVAFLTTEVILLFITLRALINNIPELIKSYLFFGVICLIVLNIIARPEISLIINDKTDKQQYTAEGLVYCKHSYIPFLIDKYKQTDCKTEKEAIKNAIILQGNNNHNADNWQSISIQEIICKNALKEFNSGL